MDVEESASMIITPNIFALVIRTDDDTKGDMILKMMGRCISQGSAEKCKKRERDKRSFIGIGLHGYRG